MIHLYTDSSPNGFKITIMLEEINMLYELHHVQIDKGENQLPEFLLLNPYGRIPVIYDDETNLTIFESAAILQYLAEKTQCFIPIEPKAHWDALVWLTFASSSMGPILGQRVHFELFDKVPIPLAIDRYRQLSENIFTVLDIHLAEHTFLAGDEYSIADIATFGWMHIVHICGFSTAHYLHLTRWYEQIFLRPAVQRGIVLPIPATGP